MWPDPTTIIPGSLKLLPTDENSSSPRVGSGGQRDQNYFHDNTEALFAFFPLILSRAYGGIFQRLREMG